MMTVGELLEILQDMDPESEIRMATQPNWPLAFELKGVAVQSEIDIDDAWKMQDESPTEDGVDEDSLRADAQNVVWLVEGSSVYYQPYAPRAAWSVV